jgi:hypothetical protein
MLVKKKKKKCNRKKTNNRFRVRSERETEKASERCPQKKKGSSGRLQLTVAGSSRARRKNNNKNKRRRRTLSFSRIAVCSVIQTTASAISQTEKRVPRALTRTLTRTVRIVMHASLSIHVLFSSMRAGAGRRVVLNCQSSLTRIKRRPAGCSAQLCFA